MGPINYEDQFQFLIACIQHSNLGKVDFGGVAKDLGIVSKGAAAKRYERLMKAAGVTPPGKRNRATGSHDNSSPATFSAAGGEAGKKTRGPVSKKRKFADAGNDDDEESKATVKSEANDVKVKKEAKDVAETKVKTEIKDEAKIKTEPKEENVKAEVQIKKEKLAEQAAYILDGSLTNHPASPTAADARAGDSGGDDGDDDVYLICATEKTSGQVAPTNHALPASDTALAGIPSFDHAVNMPLPSQTALFEPLDNSSDFANTGWTPVSATQHFMWDMTHSQSMEDA